MEQLSTALSAPPGVVITPPSTPAPMPAAAPVMESGGILKGVDWTVVVIIVVAGVFAWQTIDFYRFKIKVYKRQMSEQSTEIYQLNTRVSALEQQQEPQGSFNFM